MILPAETQNNLRESPEKFQKCGRNQAGIQKKKIKEGYQMTSKRISEGVRMNPREIMQESKRESE